MLGIVTSWRGELRRMARRLMQKQMLAAVKTADVIVTNPTHFAVALKYERGVDQAPVVLAKGENRFAQRIKALAAEHGVPLVENKPVARLLFATGKVGEPIPADLLLVVDRLPIAPRLTVHLLGNRAKVEIGRVALDLKLHEVNWLLGGNRMDTDHTRSVCHATTSSASWPMPNE